MGSYRFVLAILVALSHMGFSIRGWNPGVVAVISFFLLSGYVMALLVRRHYPDPRLVGRFYLDRAARLFPQYLAYALVAGALIWFLPVDSIYVTELSPWKVFLNLLLLPLALFMFGLEHALLIPQAWSLGLEWSFYLVIPWLLICASAGLKKAVALGSLGVFLAAYLGWIDTDWFGYRLLPGTLVFFLLGVSLAAEAKEDIRFWRGLYFVFAVLLLGCLMNPQAAARHYNQEVLLGVVLGAPIVALLRRFRFSSLDELMGNLAYGVFLNHFVILWIYEAVYGPVDLTWMARLAMICVCVAMAFVSYWLVERPALTWRRRLRHSIMASEAPVS